MNIFYTMEITLLKTQWMHFKIHIEFIDIVGQLKSFVNLFMTCYFKISFKFFTFRIYKIKFLINYLINFKIMFSFVALNKISKKKTYVQVWIS